MGNIDWEKIQMAGDILSRELGPRAYAISVLPDAPASRLPLVQRGVEPAGMRERQAREMSKGTSRVLFEHKLPIGTKVVNGNGACMEGTVCDQDRVCLSVENTGCGDCMAAINCPLGKRSN